MAAPCRNDPELSGLKGAALMYILYRDRESMKGCLCLPLATRNQFEPARSQVWEQAASTGSQPKSQHGLWDEASSLYFTEDWGTAVVLGSLPSGREAPGWRVHRDNDGIDLETDMQPSPHLAALGLGFDRQPIATQE